MMVGRRVFYITYSSYYSGYMAPEYAMHGQFSVKSDVYSFGVLVLEIVTGRKNSDFSSSEYAEDIVNHVSFQLHIYNCIFCSR